MTRLDVNGTQIGYREAGAPDGPAVVFLHALGTGAEMWEAVLPLLPQSLRLIAIDLRGHGESDCPEPPYAMGGLIRDVEGVMDQLNVNEAAVVGVGLGGMIAQGLAVKRLDLVRTLVLCNATTRDGVPERWDRLIEDVRAKGTGPLCDQTMQAWFTKDWRNDSKHLPWKKRFLAIPPKAFIGHMEAVKGTDFYRPTSSLRLAALGIAGIEDKVIPPDMTRETLDLIPGSEMRLIRKSGHLPSVDQPKEFAAILSNFLQQQGFC